MQAYTGKQYHARKTRSSRLKYSLHLCTCICICMPTYLRGVLPHESLKSKRPPYSCTIVVVNVSARISANEKPMCSSRCSVFVAVVRATGSRKSHDTVCKSHDGGCKSHDGGCKSHDGGCESHDGGYKRQLVHIYVNQDFRC
jgi:hypothetical protein